MSNESLDVRDRLVREKYFSLRPKPLEQWLWRQGVPQTAERVFWLHWEEGMKSGSWCSEIPVKRVAVLCCVDPSTVTRAYQVLKSLGLLRRQDPGRDPTNPFQQATAVTEVRVPKEVVAELGRYPNRRPPEPARGRQSGEGAPTLSGNLSMPVEARREPQGAPEPLRAAIAAPPMTRRPSRQEAQARWRRASEAERGRFFAASRDGTPVIEFDLETQLTLEDRHCLLAQLAQMAEARHAAPKAALTLGGASSPGVGAKARSLSILELARTRKQLLAIVPGAEVAERLRQIAWAVEEGALSRFDRTLALNIAVKKLREGAWTRPNRMPPNWLLRTASPEICSAA